MYRIKLIFTAGLLPSAYLLTRFWHLGAVVTTGNANASLIVTFSSSLVFTIATAAINFCTVRCVPLSSSSIIWYWPRRLISLAGKVTAGLVESNGSLPPGL